MDELINSLIPLLNAESFWVGVASAFGVMGAILNVGPCKTKLDTYGLDWLRPLVMLVSVGIGGGASAMLAGGDQFAVCIASATAGLGSGFLQKFIQEATDND